MFISPNIYKIKLKHGLDSQVSHTVEQNFQKAEFSLLNMENWMLNASISSWEKYYYYYSPIDSRAIDDAVNHQ